MEKLLFVYFDPLVAPLISQFFFAIEVLYIKHGNNLFFLEEVQNVRLLTHDGRRTTHGSGWWTKTFAIGHLTDPSDLEKNKGWSCFIHSPLNRTRGPWNTLLISTPVHQIILFWFLNFPHIYISMLNLYRFLRPLISLGTQF